MGDDDAALPGYAVVSPVRDEAGALHGRSSRSSPRPIVPWNGSSWTTLRRRHPANRRASYAARHPWIRVIGAEDGPRGGWRHTRRARGAPVVRAFEARAALRSRRERRDHRESSTATSSSRPTTSSGSRDDLRPGAAGGNRRRRDPRVRRSSGARPISPAPRARRPQGVPARMPRGHRRPAADHGLGRDRRVRRAARGWEVHVLTERRSSITSPADQASRGGGRGSRRAGRATTWGTAPTSC